MVYVMGNVSNNGTTGRTTGKITGGIDCHLPHTTHFKDDSNSSIISENCVA